MALFTRYALTDNGKALIAKSHVKNVGINFTRAATGNGEWSTNTNLETAKSLISEKQSFSFSSIEIPEGVTSSVTLTVDITNENLKELYHITEMGIFANDPDNGEVLYAILAADTNIVVMPAYNEVGISDIVERINVEVANAAEVTIVSAGAHVTADMFEDLKKIVNLMSAGLTAGESGEVLLKKSGSNYDFGWVSTNTFTGKKENFPEEGRTNALYVDTDSSTIYVWKKIDDAGTMGYQALALGADAATTLQQQITNNANAISNLKTTVNTSLSEIKLTVPTSGWEETTDDGIAVYSQEIEVKNMTEDSDATVWPAAISTTTSALVAEQEACGILFGKGKSYAETGKILLKCFEEKPEVDFGILIKGVSA